MLSQDQSLEIAHSIVDAGIPVICWKSGRHTPPSGWPSAVPDHSIIDAWQPGDKLYVVTGARSDGRGVDIVDVDPRNGGLVDTALAVEAFGQVSTPSGGVHLWLPAANVRKGSPALGIDYLAGTTDNKGRGLAAIPPTHGSLNSPNSDYSWTIEPHLPALENAAISVSQGKTVSALNHTDPLKGDPPAEKIDLPVVARAAADDYEGRYIQAKLHDKIAALVSGAAPQGMWDKTVFGASRDLVKLANAGWSALTHDEALRLYTAACEPLKDGNPDWEYRMANKFERALLEVDVALVQPANIVAGREWTDSGNGWRMADIYEDTLLCVEGFGWCEYGDGVWEIITLDKVHSLAMLCLERLAETEASMYPDPAKFLKWAHQQQAAGRIKAAVFCAAGRPEMADKASSFNADNGIVNFKNCILRIAGREVLPHDPSWRTTMQVPHEYQADAVGTEWVKLLERVLPNEDIRLAFQVMLGYTLFVDGNPDKLLAIMLGETDSGKTTILNIVAEVMQGYAKTFELSMLRGNQGDKPRPDLFEVLGARLAFTTEASNEWALHADHIKRLTGDDVMRARPNYAKQTLERKPAFVPWVATNTMPQISGADKALLRRVRVVPFEVSIPLSEQDSGLRVRIVDTEAAGVINWLLDGYDSWANGDMERMCATLDDASSAAFVETSIFAMFLEDCTFEDEEGVEPASHIGVAWDRWREEHKEQEVTMQKLGRELTGLGWKKSKGAVRLNGEVVKVREGRKIINCLSCRQDEHRVTATLDVQKWLED